MIRVVRYVKLLVTAALLFAVAVAVGLYQRGTAPPRSGPEDGVGNSSAIAGQPLALERYRVLLELEDELGGFPLYGSIEMEHHVLFPLGRSDKVYVVWMDGYWAIRGYKGEQVLCYEAKGERLRFMYRFRLKEIAKPAKDRIRVTNVLDYISLLGMPEITPPGGPFFSYKIAGRISKSAKRDLSLKQELVDYLYETPIDTLYLQCFRSSTRESLHDHERMQSFDIGESGQNDNDQWFRTYGLPVADCELTFLMPGSSLRE